MLVPYIYLEAICHIQEGSYYVFSFGQARNFQMLESRVAMLKRKIGLQCFLKGTSV
jgi:hypothetical protein